MRYVLDKPRLLERLENALRPLKFNDKAVLNIHSAFEISYETHLIAPPRKRGEPFFMHCFRQFIHAAKLMRIYDVKSSDLLCAILCHDSVEDAKKGGKTETSVRYSISMNINHAVEYTVLSLSKMKPFETRDVYLERVCKSEMILVLIAKPFDSNDNMVTLAWTDIEKQAIKVREIFVYFPRIRERAIRLLEVEGASGEIKDWQQWVRLVNHIHRTLRHNAWKQRRRLEARGIKVM